MTRVLRDFLLFFQRDLQIASSYRSPFILELVEALFGATTFYYVALFVDSPQLRESLPRRHIILRVFVGWVCFFRLPSRGAGFV